MGYVISMTLRCTLVFFGRQVVDICHNLVVQAIFGIIIRELLWLLVLSCCGRYLHWGYVWSSAYFW